MSTGPRRWRFDWRAVVAEGAGLVVFAGIILTVAAVTTPLGEKFAHFIADLAGR